MPTPTLEGGSGTGGSGTGQSTTLSLTLPSGTQVNDIILVYIGASAASTWSSGSGSTAFTAQAETTSAPCVTLLTHTYTGSEGWTPGTTSLTFTSTANVTNAGVILAVNASSPGPSFDPALSGSGQHNASSTTVSVPGVTTTVANDLLVWFAATSTASGATPATITVPTGFTAGVTQVNTSDSSKVNIGVIFGTATAGAAGATGAENGTMSVANNNAGLLVSLSAPAGAVVLLPIYPEVHCQGVNRAASF